MFILKQEGRMKKKYKNSMWFVCSLAACQCNGHSQCVNESVCEKCEDLTTGRHCESCVSGFYGDPTNGGSCQREYRPRPLDRPLRLAALGFI